MKMVIFTTLILGGGITCKLCFNLLGKKNMYTKAGKEETDSSILIVKLLE